MALSRKPVKERNTVEEEKLTELILKGGSSPDDLATAGERPADKKVYVQLRISPAHLHEIDEQVKKRPGMLSRHTWIMEAIAEKIEQDIRR